MAIRRLVADLTRYMDLARELPTGELLYQFLVDSGWLARMSKAASARDEAEVQNISRFFRRIQDAAKALRYDNVREFVNHLDALIDAGEDPAVVEADTETPAVHVLTVHKAKGLEFPVVFLVEPGAGQVPAARAARSPGGSRGAGQVPAARGRLPPARGAPALLRGMTRARRELFLTSARDYGGARPRKVSQFVLEALDLPKDATRPFKAKPIEEIQRFAPPAESGGDPSAPIPAEQELLLSHRQVDDYDTCPLKYRYVHVLRVPILRHHTVVYGNTIHKVVEYYLLRRVAGNYTPLEDLLAVFEREWENQGFLTWEHEEARKAAGRAALTRFWHQEEAEGARPTYVEKDFGFSLGPDRVRGRFDRVDEDLLGATIIDYKTSEVTTAKEAARRVAKSLQLKMYALAWREMTRRPPPARGAALHRVTRGGAPRAHGGGRGGGGDRRQARGRGHPGPPLRGHAVAPHLPLLRLQPDLPLHRHAGVTGNSSGADPLRADSATGSNRRDTARRSHVVDPLGVVMSRRRPAFSRSRWPRPAHTLRRRWKAVDVDGLKARDAGGRSARPDDQPRRPDARRGCCSRRTYQ